MYFDEETKPGFYRHSVSWSVSDHGYSNVMRSLPSYHSYTRIVVYIEINLCEYYVEPVLFYKLNYIVSLIYVYIRFYNVECAFFMEKHG